MYELLSQPSPDEILQLSISFARDSRPAKIDLGIGVYKDSEGAAPVMKAIKSAEAVLVNQEKSKAYIGLAGDEAYNSALQALVLADTVSADRVRTIQTPGGAAAVRVLFELVKKSAPGATVWISDPTWINHHPIAKAVGLNSRGYGYFDPASQTLRFEKMLQDLSSARPCDVVLLHGCCHNPTGVNLELSHWAELARSIMALGLVPMVDLAYLGFGEGLEKDAEGLRLLASVVPEMLVAVTCSKSFGLYRERAGCAMVIARSAHEANLARANLLGLARVNYSFSPSHGASVVRLILEDRALRSAWSSELDAMRLRMNENRRLIARLLRERSPAGRFDHLERQRGMFSLIGLDQAQIERLRVAHAIYMPSDGRLNISGINERNAPVIAEAIEALSL
jgi:aromatic-amino-acid transaminase